MMRVISLLSHDSLTFLFVLLFSEIAMATADSQRTREESRPFWR